MTCLPPGQWIFGTIGGIRDEAVLTALSPLPRLSSAWPDIVIRLASLERGAINVV